MQPFDVKNVALQDSNLIEASAGTGKTYSIAILVLRLMLEKNFLLKEILMVTFTTAAVEELQTRIREFVRIAAAESEGFDGGDACIHELVKRAQQTQGEAVIQERLKNAVLLLDETSILTIHSFCQRTLTEYAFETGQVFGVETLSTDGLDEMVTEALNQFWRKYITSLDIRLIKHLGTDYLSRTVFKDYVKTALSGKKWVSKQTLTPQFLDASDQQMWIQQLVDDQKAADTQYDHIIQKLTVTDYERYLNGIKENKVVAKKMLPLFETKQGEKIFEVIQKDFNQVNLQKVFGDLDGDLQALATAKARKSATVDDFYSLLIQFAIQEIVSHVIAVKEEKSWITFDDMITNLHHAIAVENKPALIQALRSKYKAAFIDEFQDTDKLQYEIFDRIFGSDSILFYIGDPKQAIYSFRKADIFTYFKAAEGVRHQYSMNTNFRSSKAMITAMNVFFSPAEQFDTFYFKEEKPGIHYTQVHAPDGDTKGQLLWNGTPVTSIQMVEGGSQALLQDATLGWVAQLLDQASGYQLQDKKELRGIRPSDIGILVRTNEQGRAIKDLLSAYNIPSITIDEAKIFHTAEAQDLLYLLEAVYDITPSSINKALLTDLAGKSVKDLLQLQEEEVLQRFKAYQQAWNKEGIYVMLMMFLTDYQLKRRWLSGNVEQGERRLSNVLQMLELLHKMQTRKQYAPAELINWMKKGLEGSILEGDEMELRIESDEDAVKIVSIHKSKGLEYNIVIAPHLDLKATLRPNKVQFRDATTGAYFFGRADQLEAPQTEQAVLLEHQENRRLLYVAITRAKYACFIGHNTFKNADSCLTPFIAALKSAPILEFQQVEMPTLPAHFKFSQHHPFDPVQFKKAQQFELLQPNWRKMSYSYLNPDHSSSVVAPRVQHTDPYDQYIFRDLKKGAHTGNLLHYIFEHIDFADATYWEKVVKQALKRLSVKEEPQAIEMLLQMLGHVMQTPLDGFKLCDLQREDRLNELEFDFNVKPFQTNDLLPLAPVKLRSFQQLEGVMNGKIDLFFRMNGKYYVLDWKSNFLGDSLEQYDTAGVEEAMAENNYHLQYHLYTIAAKRFLQTRLPNFNYEQDFGGVYYLFLRGVRKEGGSGIFHTKLTESQVQAMEEILSVPLKA